MSDTLFTIDIGEKLTRVLDGEKKQDKFEISAAASAITVPNYFTVDTEKIIEEQSDNITRIAAGLKLKKKNVNVVIPDTYSYSQVLSMPKLNEKELLSAISYQADQFIPMPINEVTLDIEILKEDDVNKKLTILIVATPKKLVEKVEKTIEYAGLIPDSLENELSAAGRFFSELYKPKLNSAYLAFNFGATTSSLYLIDARTTLLLMTRTFKIGYDLFIKDLKVNLNVEDSKAMELLKTVGLEKSASYDIFSIVMPIMNEAATEIKKIQTLTQDRLSLPVQKLFVFNHNFLISAFDKKISELSGVPAQSLNMPDYLVSNPVSQSFVNQLSGFTVAIGGNLR